MILVNSFSLRDLQSAVRSRPRSFAPIPPPSLAVFRSKPIRSFFAGKLSFSTRDWLQSEKQKAARRKAVAKAQGYIKVYQSVSK